MQQFLDEWLTNLLKNRADKSWEPRVLAHPDVVALYPKIGGHDVTAVSTLQEGSLEVRCAKDVKSEDKKALKFCAGQVLASYAGIR